jgi:hypothetical protein
MRHCLKLSTCLLLAHLIGTGLPQPSIAQGWPGNPTVNVAISRDGLQEQHPRIVSDGALGAIIVWEYATVSSGLDLMIQRVDAGGAVLWPSPTYITSFLAYDQRDPRMISDGAGGAIIAWTDHRDEGPTGGDIYVQRINSSGTVLWGTNGHAICGATDIQAYPELCSDGAGGAIVTWRDSRNYASTGVDIYAQRVSADGTPLWTPFGVPICTTTGNQLDPIITGDGSGGAVIAWMDSRSAYTNTYMQRVNASGVKHWTSDGVGYLINTNATWLTGRSPIVGDGTGGAIVVYVDDYSGSTDLDIRAVRVNGSGNLAWSPGSRVICWETGIQKDPRVVSDNGGAAIVTWTDYRAGTSDPNIYAQKIDTSGALKWTVGGACVCGVTGTQEAPTIAGDVFRGAIITWNDSRAVNISGVDVYAQRLDEWGTPQWTTDGIPVSIAGSNQYSPFIASAGSCGAIVVWYDYRNVGSSNWDIYAQRVFCDGSLIAPTGVTETAPYEFTLNQNYPNPFNPKTVVSFQLPVASDVRLVVCDLLGRELLMLLNDRLNPGIHMVTLDGSNLASGVYIYRMTAGQYVESKKMVLLR